jgi:hypothetical protein
MFRILYNGFVILVLLLRILGCEKILIGEQMAKRKINIADYDYVCYMDGSGNDGFVYDVPNGGSSTCYSVAYFLMKPADHELTLSILRNIKNLLRISPDDEVKYKTVRKHKARSQVLNELRGLPGVGGSLTCFKKEMTADIFSDLKQKALTSISHSLLADIVLEKYKGRILIVMDMMKQVEMDNIHKLNEGDDIIFRDSKDAAFPFIQFADILSGVTREFFEWSLSSPTHRNFARRCSICKIRKSLCAHDKKNKPILKSMPLFRIIRIFEAPVKNRLENIKTIPAEKMLEEYLYFKCI